MIFGNSIVSIFRHPMPHGQSRGSRYSSHSIQPSRPRRPRRTWKAIHLLIILCVLSLVCLIYPGVISNPLTSMSSAERKTIHIRYPAVSGGMAPLQFIAPRYPISYRIGGLSYLSYSIKAGASIRLAGYPPGGVGDCPIELITTRCPQFDASYGRDTRRSEAILFLSILTPYHIGPIYPT